MKNIFFIYAKTLTDAEINQFSQATQAVLIGSTHYLGYRVAFFNGDITDTLREKATEIKIMG